MRFINQLSSQLGTGKKQTHETRNGQRKNTGNNANYLIIIWASIPWPCKYVFRGNVNKLINSKLAVEMPFPLATLHHSGNPNDFFPKKEKKYNIQSEKIKVLMSH